MTDETLNGRAMLRVRRFLERGDARLDRSAADGRVLLDGGERGVIGLEAALLEKMREEGAVVVEKDTVRLPSAGARAGRRSADALRAPPREHDEIVVTTGAGPETVVVNAAESPLALLWRHKDRNGERFLSAGEFRAGERLRADYSRGQIMPRLGVNWGAAGASGRKHGDANGIAEMTDAALAARRRVERAIEAVGPELSGVLIDICCFLKGLERVEIERGWPARSAKVVLKSALAALARHYEPPKKSSGKTILHWGAEDYRPTLG